MTEEDEEASNSSIDLKAVARKAERKKVKQRQFEDMMYICYLAEKNNNSWKFARTMSEPLNVDSNREELPDQDIDGNLVTGVEGELEFDPLQLGLTSVYIVKQTPHKKVNKLVKRGQDPLSNLDLDLCMG